MLLMLLPQLHVEILKNANSWQLVLLFLKLLFTRNTIKPPLELQLRINLTRPMQEPYDRLCPTLHCPYLGIVFSISSTKGNSFQVKFATKIYCRYNIPKDKFIDMLSKDSSIFLHFAITFEESKLQCQYNKQLVRFIFEIVVGCFASVIMNRHLTILMIMQSQLVVCNTTSQQVVRDISILKIPESL